MQVVKPPKGITFIELLIGLALISILLAIVIQPRMSGMFPGYGYGMGGYGMGGYGMGYNAGYYGSPWRREIDIATPLVTNSNVASTWSSYAYAPPNYMPPAYGMMGPGGYMGGMGGYGMGAYGMGNPYGPYGINPYGMYGSYPPGMNPYMGMYPYGMPPYYGMPMGMPMMGAPVMGMTVAQIPAGNQGVNVTNWIVTTNWVMATNSNSNTNK
jgi:prepilin-type N-terminal cleavage/methylation domain-containing protein